MEYRHENGNGAVQPSYGDAAAEEEISIREVVETLVKSKWLILAAFLVTLAITAVYTLRQDPIYEAYSTILVSSQQTSPVSLDAILSPVSGNARNISNEIEILKSRSMAERVAGRVIVERRLPGTDQTYSVLGAADRPIEPLTVAQRIRGRVSVNPLRRDVDLIEVRASSTIPEEAAALANLYANEYRDRNRELSRSRTTASRTFLEKQEERLRSTVQQTEDALRAFQEQAGVVALDQVSSQLVTQIAQVQAQRDEAQLEMSVSESELAALQEQANQVEAGLASMVVSAGMRRQIDGITERLSSLKLLADEKYSMNPDLRGNESLDKDLEETVRQIAYYERQLDQLAARYASAAGSDAGSSGSVTGNSAFNLRQQIIQKSIEVSAQRARWEALARRLNQLESDFNRIPGKSLQLARLQRETEASDQLYRLLNEKLQEARVAESSEVGNVEIIDSAIVNRQPVSPNVARNLVVGVLFGMLMGIGLAFLRNALDNRIRKPEELRKKGFGVLGVIPNMQRVVRADFGGKERVSIDGRSYSTSLVALLNPLSPIAETYRRLRTNIQFSRPDVVVKNVLVTSPGPGEGKTVTALNLAITMAQDGRRTVYIDADLRRPSGHKALGIKPEPGLSDLLFEAHHDWSRYETGVDNFYVIPAGSAAPNPAEMLGSKKMRDLLKRLGEDFDVVVIDSPPVLAATDAVLLATQSDANVVVVSAGETDWYALERCVEAMGVVGAGVTGTILNRFDPKTAYGYYGYGYGYGYYDHYSDGRSRSTLKPV